MAPGAEQNRTRRRTVLCHAQAVDNRQVVQAVDNSHVPTVDNRQVAQAGERTGRWLTPGCSDQIFPLCITLIVVLVSWSLEKRVQEHV